MAEPATKRKTSSTISDWTQLPEELLDVISEKVENCFDVVHARSVCRSWRSAFLFPSCLLGETYSLPTFPIEKVGLCSFEKVPLFFFRVRASAAAASVSKCILGGIHQVKPEDLMELPSPLQCSVKLEIKGSDPTLVNTAGCQIFSIGHQCQMICWNPEGLRTTNRGVAFLQLGGGEFVVLPSYLKTLLVLTSAERRWKRLKNIPEYASPDVVSFRGKFYAAFHKREVFVIDPCSLKVTPLRPSKDPINYLVPSGNDEELFLAEEAFNHVVRITFKVSRLAVEAGRWVEVTDLGDRVLFLGDLTKVACSVKELPVGCGVSGNSVLFTNRTGETSFFHKYIKGCWRTSRKSRVHFLDSKSPVLGFRVVC